MDAKDWGLAIKEVVFGIGGGAAGLVGGPAAAEGVAKADKALDRLIEGGTSSAKPPRSERFDRADFGARTKAPPEPARVAEVPSAPKTAPVALAHERAAERGATLPPAPEAPPPDPPSTQQSGEDGIAADFLRSVGWSAEKVDGILGGPAKPSGDRPDSEAARGAATPREVFRTFEVYGVQGGHAVPLMSILDRKEGRWQVRPGAQVRATDRATVGMGLAGSPGRWREYYPNHQPEQYGLHAGKAVLYWEPQRGRALAASGGLLTQLFGRNWRSTVYRTEEEHG